MSKTKATAVQDAAARRDEIQEQLENLQEELKNLDYEIQVDSGKTKKKKVNIGFGAVITVYANIPAVIECAEWDGSWTPVAGKGDIEDAIWKFLDVGTITINRKAVEVTDIEQHDLGFTAELADTGEVIYEY